MSKAEDRAMTAALAKLFDTLDETAPKPKRKYVKSANWEQMQQQKWERARLGYDPSPPKPKLPPGRPKGSKNKPKPEGYVAVKQVRGPYLPPLTWRNAPQHFALERGGIRRIYKTNQIGLDCRVKPAGNNSPRTKWQAWHVKHAGQFFLAAEVAWWLLTGKPVPDGYTVVCTDLADLPRYTAETLEVQPVKAKRDGSRVDVGEANPDADILTILGL